MFLFSFELDVLEIALREQQDLVDKIFLVESSATHRGVIIFQNISEYSRIFYKTLFLNFRWLSLSCGKL